MSIAATESITIDGAGVRCADVEDTIESGVHEVVARASCAVQPVSGGPIVLLAEIDRDSARDPLSVVARHVRAVVAVAHRIAADEVVLLAPGELAGPAGGAVDREQVLERYRRNALAPLLVDSLAAPVPAGPSPRPGPVRPRARPVVGGNPVTIDSVRAEVAELLGADPADLGVDEDLTLHALDSVGIMSLVGQWRARGRDVRFAELIEEPTLQAWTVLLVDAPPIAAPAEAAPSTEPFPLTSVQYAYWVGRADDQPLGGVSAHYYLELDGPGLDPGLLERAVRALLDRQPGLRTRVLDDGTQQVLARSAWPGLPVRDLRDTTEAERAAELERVRADLAHRRLDVAAGEVLDVGLSLLPDGSRLHLNVDLIAADVLSIRILLGELAALYADPDVALPPLTVGVADHLAARTAARAGAREADRRWWADRLPDLPGPPDLPLAGDPATIRPVRFSRHTVSIAAGDRARLAERAAAFGVTLPMVLITVYAEVLAAWSGRPRFLLNVPLFDRAADQPGLDALVADFTNLVLLDADLSGRQSFGDRARGLQARFREAAAHSEYSGVDVLRDLRRARPDVSLAAPVVFTSAVGMGELIEADVRAGLGEPGWSISQTPQIWLDHQVVESGGGLAVNFDAVDGLFDDGVVPGMTEAYGRLVARLAGPGDEQWSEPVPTLVGATSARARAAVNDTTAPLSRRLLHDDFFARARTGPDRPALLLGLDGEPGRGCWTYGELADRALAVAGGIAARTEPGDPVAVHLPKGPEQIAAVLGVLAAGRVYVPVGIDQPAHRRDAVLAAAGISVVLDGSPDPSGAPSLPAPLPVANSETAYIIFTSGSTGAPKGVEETHRAAVNTVEDISARFGIDQDDRVLAISALDFDLSVYDVFGLLGAGGALVLVEEAERREARRWWDLADGHGVTVWNTVPALLEMLLDGAPGSALPAALRLAMVSGDWVALGLPQRVARAGAGRCRLVALGGATEAAIWSNAFDASGGAPPGWRSVPYGFPLRNQRFRVVDDAGRDRPDQVAGELWIGGEGVARGYRGDPDRTAEKFVDAGGERWYRTGDRGRYRSGAILEFLGRDDHQVKIRGHRIELGEIEAALLAHPAVGAAVAVTHRPGTAGGAADAGPASGARQLAGFVVAAGDRGPDADELRDFLSERLASYAVPTSLHVLHELPLTANGKVDRSALAAMANAGRGRPAAAAPEPPRGAVELRVAACWAEMLDLGTVSRDDHFVTLGGDSLVATRVVTMLRAQGFPGAGLGALFASPVLHEYAATLGRAAERAAPAAPVIPADPEHRFDPFPATEVQRAYWLGRSPEFVLGGVGCHWYTEFDGPDVDVARLEKAWNRLIGRHDMLRAIFDDEGGQRVLPEVPRFTIPLVEATGDGAAELAALRAAMSAQVLDPARWPLVDVRTVRYGRRTRVGISMDNIVLDALSIALVFGELDVLYRDPDAVLPPLGLTFRDYVLGVRPDPERERAAQEHWRRRAGELPPPPDLPLVADPGDVGPPRFARRETHVPAHRWREICASARRHGLTPSSVLATAFAEVLGAWSGERRLTLTITLFDRRDVHPDVVGVVGDFTSLLLLGYEPGPGDGWLDAARGLQTRMAADLEHSDTSAVWVLREQARRTGTSTASAPVVFTSTIGTGTLGSPDRAFGERVWGISQTPQVWLDHQVTEVDGGLTLVWDAARDLFAPGVLDAMFAAEAGILDALADPDAWYGPVPVVAPAAVVGERAAARASTAVSPAGPTVAGPPAGPLEESLAALVADVLDVGVVGRDDNFVTLGGDSLAATRLMRRVRETTGAEVPLRTFFAGPTVCELATVVAAWLGDDDMEDGVL